MKILHIIDTTGPGGAETIFIQLADLLRHKGYQSLVVIRGPGWVKCELERRGLTPVIMNVKGSFAIGFLYRLFRLATKEKVDLIQSHLLGSNVYAAILGILIRRPVVATFHGMVDVNPDERFRLLKNRVMQWGISRYVAVSHSLAEKITTQKLLDPAKTEIIYNGVDVKRYGKSPHSSLRQQLGLPDDAVLVGSLGNVRPAKAYDVLIDMAAMAVRQHRKLHFVIAGHKRAAPMETLFHRAKALNITGHVNFIGFVDSGAEFLAQLDFFLLSSRSEGFSIATIEAMMSGLPVIATRCGGPEEIVIHGETGLLVEAENPRALCDGLLQLVNDREFACRLADAGQRHARARFSIETMLNAYRDIYRSVGEGRHLRLLSETEH